MAFAASAEIAIGPAAISDMFFHHEKGKRMGFNTFLLVCAPFLGGVSGGSIQQNPALGWRWAMYISAILYGILFVCQWFFVPETLYEKAPGIPPYKAPTTKLGHTLHKFGFRFPANPYNKTWGYHFSRCFTMFAYPAVLLPSIWFSISGMTEVANTAEFPLNFGPNSRYKFNTRQIGFCSFSGFVGAVLGETVAGPLCDLVAKRHLRREGGEHGWRPEKLLVVIWTGVVTISAGLLLYGLELNFPSMGDKSYIPALIGIAIFVLGQEIEITVLLTYMTDCYPQQAAEVVTCFQFWLNVMAYHPNFYTPQWIAIRGAWVPYTVYAILPIVLFPPMVGVFMWRDLGPRIRARGPVFACGSRRKERVERG